VMVFTTFVIPFVVLLAREAKRRAPTLLVGALSVLLGRAVEIYWMIAPSLHIEASFSWLNVTGLLGVAGLFLGTVAWRLGKGPLIPVGDPYLRKSLEHENV